MVADQPNRLWWPSDEGRGGVLVAWSGVANGDMSLGSSSSDGVANRERFLRIHGLGPAETVVMGVSHADGIARVSDADRGRGVFAYRDAIEADALVTDTPGLALLLTPADCVPLVLWDQQACVLALIHCGWRSTDLAIAQRVVTCIEATWGKEPTELHAFLGPGIKACSYRRMAPSQLHSSRWRPYVLAHADGSVAIDLYAHNRDQLLRAGVRCDAIEESNVDTGGDVAYFSHSRALRSGEPDGRNAVMAMLVRRR
jgi:copper oxidase (laccase) domain-containing protein